MASLKETNGTVDLRVVANDIKYIQKDMAEIKATLNSSYVTKDQFDPIRRIVYGVVTLMMIAVVGAIMGLVLRGK